MEAFEVTVSKASVPSSKVVLTPQTLLFLFTGGALIQMTHETKTETETTTQEFIQIDQSDKDVKSCVKNLSIFLSHTSMRHIISHNVYKSWCIHERLQLIIATCKRLSGIHSEREDRRQEQIGKKKKNVKFIHGVTFTSMNVNISWNDNHYSQKNMSVNLGAYVHTSSILIKHIRVSQKVVIALIIWDQSVWHLLVSLMSGLSHLVMIINYSYHCYLIFSGGVFNAQTKITRAVHCNSNMDYLITSSYVDHVIM